MSSAPTLESILGLAGQFLENRIFLTGAELDLFTLLAPAPLPAPEVAARTKTDLRAVTILLDALAAMGLLLKEEGRYQTEPSAAPLLRSDSPDSVRPMILHRVSMWRSWSDLTQVVKRGAPEKPASMFRDEKETRAFIGAMHVVGSALAPQIVAAINPGPARALLDVGGGSGTYTQAFLEAEPQMRATLFDRPEVIALAREQLGQAGLLDRVTLVGGDFYREELPSGHDLVLT